MTSAMLYTLFPAAAPFAAAMFFVGFLLLLLLEEGLG